MKNLVFQKSIFAVSIKSLFYDFVVIELLDSFDFI